MTRSYHYCSPVFFSLSLLLLSSTALGMGQGCDSPELKPETKQSIEEAKKLGCVCSSGFRTKEEQAAAFARAGGAGNNGAAAPPGRSRHEQGAAFDCPTKIECPAGLKRLDNAAHAGMSHCSDTGG